MSGADSTKSPVAALFDAVADDYDQSGVDFFQPIAEGLVRALDPQAGERVLDIGCGRGAVTLGLAERVLPGGTVTGLDLSEAMVEHARRLLAERGHSADLRVGDATAPELPQGTFDVVASSLVLFFLREPAAALERWVQLAAPGGRIGLATFGDQDAVWDAVDAEFEPWLPPMMRDPRTTGPDSPFASDAGMERLMSDAGAVQVRTVTARLPVRFGTLDRWEAFSRSTGQRLVWSRIPPEEVGGFVDRVGAHLDASRNADGDIEVWQDIRYTLGVAPGTRAE
jgi:ubiquinone/menaquinone biosynthesis C-methylase UbiE